MRPSAVGPRCGLFLYIALLTLCCRSATVAQTTINATNRLAYGANLGWMNLRGDVGDGMAVGDYFCSGFIYGANIGWINLGNGHPANGVRYQNNSTTDFGINHDGLGNLRGDAYSANLGWVAFEDLGTPRVDLMTGILSGWIYSANAGWISLSNTVAFAQTDRLAPGEDSDGDGIADAYEILWTGGLTRMNATSDLDGDGVSDRQEFLAETNPLDPADQLRITAFGFSSDGTNSSATWTTRSNRFYRVETRPDFNPGSFWTDSGLGWIVPDGGSTTRRALTNTPARQRFLRIEAARPLSP